MDDCEKIQVHLREATQKKKAKSYDDAINSLKKAYELMCPDNYGISVNERVRLPQYLQLAGRNDEAWGAFNDLIRFLNSNDKKEFLYLDLEKVYDKMRLFLQRENRFDESIALGVQAYLSFVLGIYFQSVTDDESLEYYKKDRIELLNEITKEDYIQGILEPLLKKAKRTIWLDDLVDVVVGVVRDLPDYRSFQNRFDEVSKYIRDHTA